MVDVAVVDRNARVLLVDHELPQVCERARVSKAAGELMAARRLEDERFALFAEAALVLLDLPDAVFRGYEGDAELLSAPREDDEVALEAIKREIVRLEPQKVYFPLGVGDHVDHQLIRRVGMSLLADGRRWVMPGPDWAGSVTFYEDFPYAWWNGFSRLEDLSARARAEIPDGISLWAEYADISDQVERKITGVSLYESQVDRLFGGVKPMADATRRQGRRIAALGGLEGAFAERYWTSVRV